MDHLMDGSRRFQPCYLKVLAIGTEKDFLKKYKNRKTGQDLARGTLVKSCSFREWNFMERRNDFFDVFWCKIVRLIFDLLANFGHYYFMYETIKYNYVKRVAFEV